MKKILFIATGGTIASKKSKNGLKPQISPEELLSYIPSLKNVCEIDAIQLLNLDSTNMEPSHWCQIVDGIHKNYEIYDGFVVAHGTPRALIPFFSSAIRRPAFWGDSISTRCWRAASWESS